MSERVDEIERITLAWLRGLTARMWPGHVVNVASISHAIGWKRDVAPIGIA